MFLQRNITAGWRQKSLIPKKDQPQFLSRLSELKESGYPLNQAIEFLLLPYRKKPETPRKIHDSLLSGDSLSDVMKTLGFPQFVCMHLFFAEEYGDLTKTLKETSDLMKMKQREEKRLISILQYPFFLIMMFSFILIIMNHYLIPRMKSLYAAVGSTESAALKTAGSIFTAMPQVILFSTCLIVLSLVSLYVILKRLSAHSRWSFLASLPVIGFYVKSFHSYVFSREASAMLKSGLSFYQMLESFISQPYRPLYQEIGQFMMDELKRGQNVYHTMLQLPFFSDELSNITRHGELNGSLEREWGFYSTFCLSDLESKTNTAFSFIQPILFTLLGLAVIGAYLIVLLPVFQLMQSI
ncbi:competence type IV pilus assembly protein ComGB [Jeotgalibacillus aurantiacus]|uniref:competence type IV pilus assembly protein ComGB n=1 Tax=Jeotgalibacillus aurantiacus TaxID=2763266 RepID=UPI001D0B0E94|nr:competence type IV pilus assembly protein ComGB [Jeotgalibacillus aurantiacus]